MISRIKSNESGIWWVSWSDHPTQDPLHFLTPLFRNPRLDINPSFILINFKPIKIIKIRYKATSPSCNITLLTCFSNFLFLKNIVFYGHRLNPLFMLECNWVQVSLIYLLMWERLAVMPLIRWRQNPFKIRQIADTAAYTILMVLINRLKLCLS